MIKYKARFTIDKEVTLEAGSAAEAAQHLRKLLIGEDACLLGVIPADQAWPDEEEVTKRPPRNTPPGGSPGTPTLDAQPELVQAVAA